MVAARLALEVAKSPLRPLFGVVAVAATTWHFGSHDEAWSLPGACSTIPLGRFKRGDAIITCIVQLGCVAYASSCGTAVFDAALAATVATARRSFCLSRYLWARLERWSVRVQVASSRVSGGDVFVHASDATGGVAAVISTLARWRACHCEREGRARGTIGAAGSVHSTLLAVIVHCTRKILMCMVSGRPVIRWWALHIVMASVVVWYRKRNSGVTFGQSIRASGKRLSSSGSYQQKSSLTCRIRLHTARLTSGWERRASMTMSATGFR